MKTWTRCILVVMAVGFLATPAPADETEQVTVKLTLDAAARNVPMDIVLQRGKLGWDKVYFRVDRFNASTHQAVVAGSTVTRDKIELDLVTKMASDAWIKGGWGRYKVILTRVSGNRFSGSYEGMFWDAPLAGAASAVVMFRDNDAQGSAHVKPIEPMEHPRLLFRKSDLPALKAKAQTPFGKEALSQMNGVIGTALRYQLEGSKHDADDAVPMVKALMADQDLGDKAVRCRVLGWRMEQVALAYDLCYDAWSPEFRAEVEQYIMRDSWVPFTGTAQLAEQIKWDPLATYPMPIRYGPALAALAIWGLPGEKPTPPPTTSDEIPTIKADPDFQPGKGVTVCDFQSNTMPSEWLIARGFAEGSNEALLAALGGADKARPEVGTTLSDGEKTDTFRVIEHNKEAGHYGSYLDLARASGRQWHTTAVLFTAVRMDQTRVVQVRTGNPEEMIFLSGRQVRDGELVQLDKGVHPLLILANVGKTNAWGQLQKKPCLIAFSDQEIQELQAKQKRDYACAIEFYKADEQRWEKSGGMDLRVLDLFGASLQSMNDYLWKGFGTGGYMRAAVGSLHGPGKYAVAYRNAFGEPITPEADIEMYLPRQMFVTFFEQPGQTKLFDLRGDAGFIESEYQGVKNYLSNYLSALFPLVPEKYQPTVLWGWWQYLGITSETETAKLLHETFAAMKGYPTDSYLAWTFVNYPLGMKPVPPAGVMPLTWKTEGLATCGFRNKWTGDDVCALQVAVDCGNQAPGAFVLSGYGSPRLEGKHAKWTSENVVQLPGVDIDPNAGALLTDYAASEDGSGSITLDYGPVYRTAQTGVAGTRTMAVDYSGKSGATAVVVIADKVTGFDHPIWSSPFIDGGFVLSGYKPANEYREKAPQGTDISYPALSQKFAKELAEHARQTRDANRDYVKYVAERDELFKGLTIEGDTFRIERDGVVLQGRVFSNKPVEVKKDDVENVGFSFKMTVIYSVSSGLVARGGNEFLVVMTLSKGPTPKIEATGNGLDAKVKIGNQQIAYDNGKIVIK